MEELTEGELKELDEICAFVWANDPSVTILDNVDHPEDENAPHGVNEEQEMVVSADPEPT